MSTKQSRQTKARKDRQAERRAREALERAAIGRHMGPKNAAEAAKLSTERLREIVRSHRPRPGPTFSTGMEMALAAAMLTGMEVRRR